LVFGALTLAVTYPWLALALLVVLLALSVVLLWVAVRMARAGLRRLRQLRADRRRRRSPEAVGIVRRPGDLG
jgi:threonine/homoserine/homoserine lactone efflux protein